MGKPSWQLALLALLFVHQSVSAAGDPIAKISSSGDAIEWERQVEGRAMTSSLPLYRSGAVRYFSAGVGLEERSTAYPPFPLKIVFTAGGKPFLSGVAVTIQPIKGAAVAIPRERVDGPWLFVELAPGLYEIAATYGDQTEHRKAVKVESGKQTVVYFRWKEDRGVAVKDAE